MPRLSLYRPNKTNDYRFLDRNIKEQFTVGGADIFVHKYAGVKMGAESQGDTTLPFYDEENPLFVEDLLLLENRNRSYEDDVHTMRGVYKVQELDFDLSQFGIFLQNDTLFINFHYNYMIDTIGRKLMNGDVLEIPNLKDYHPLDTTIPKALPKFYVINDASFAADGFSATWLPHVWRVKAVPLVGSQEYKDILDDYMDTDGGIDGDDGTGNGSGTLADFMCQHKKNMELAEAGLTQANIDVPLSGYDVTKFYIVSTDDYESDWLSADDISVTVDTDYTTVDQGKVSPISDGYIMGYLTGTDMPPNGLPVKPMVSFPPDGREGDYVLRIDYAPKRLFRYDGNMWEKINDSVRTDTTLGAVDNETLRASFVNNDDTISTSDRGDIPSKQALNDLLRPSEDN